MAKECFEKAYAINPTGPEIAGSYLYMMSFVSQWKDYKSVLATIESDQEFVTSRSFPSVVFENNPQANLAYARSHIKSKFAPTNILGDLKPHARKDKIRIGYYSSDFYHHATVMLIEGMLREHDRGRFELYAFSLDLTKPDHYNARIRELFDHYHDVSRLSDGAVTLLSRQLEIDIAIDLKGFTEGSRTAIFAERAAPVQINYLGFPGSMGAPYMDYMVADRYTVTPQTRAYFDEKIIYMPDCYQPNNPGRPSPGQGSLRPPELSESKFVFCSFNNTYKLTPTVFDLWLRILHQAPDSVLWMLKTTQQAEANLLAYIKDAGMDPSRIVFAPILTETEHLKRFAHADLFMDSFPCNAHTTASDALWAGVPLITRSGSTFASRVAGSILHAVGLEELIVDSEAAYEALALRIYKDRAYHRQLKQRVKDGVDNGALYDVVKYTRAFEQALIEVHERHRRGEAPQDLEAVSRLDKPTALLSAS
jgi:predicted O-linked N-acetylglucosamine transferase (SPINDLY family)